MRPFFIYGYPMPNKIINNKYEPAHLRKPPPGAVDHLEDRRGRGAVGGARGLEDVCRLMRLAQDRGWPLFFLGRGSNVLIDDAGLPGLTLHLAKSLQGLERHGDTLRAGAGVALPRLAQAAARLGFAGFEFLAGIPGTVGAAVRLNAGAEGASLAGVLKRVWVATPQLQLLEFTPRGTGPGLPFLAAAQLPPLAGGGGGISPLPPRRARGHPGPHGGLNRPRKTRQPANPRSCGSVFKNPAGGPAAGWLIEPAGFKGRSLGDAVVSRKHANFILNAGHATAAQVKALMPKSRNKSGGPRGSPWSGKWSFCRRICLRVMPWCMPGRFETRRLRVNCHAKRRCFTKNLNANSQFPLPS